MHEHAQLCLPFTMHAALAQLMYCPSISEWHWKAAATFTRQMQGGQTLLFETPRHLSACLRYA